MPRIRIVTAGVIFAAAAVMAAGDAAAQTATDAAPGTPIPLLQVLAQPSQVKTRTHFRGRRLSRRHRRSHIAAMRRRRWRKRAIAVAAAKAMPRAATMSAANIWPNAPTAAPANVAVTESPPAPPASVLPVPSELVVGGQTVQVASPDRANAIDLAAGTGAAASGDPAARDASSTDPSTATASAAGPNAQTASAAATSAPAPNDTVGAAAKSDSMKAEPKAAPPQKDSPVGSASWIAQVLAALGGAVAAGSLAWILIGSAPQRTYG